VVGHREYHSRAARLATASDENAARRRRCRCVIARDGIIYAKFTAQLEAEAQAQRVRTPDREQARIR
jgi:hypothetical protein